MPKRTIQEIAKRHLLLSTQLAIQPSSIVANIKTANLQLFSEKGVSFIAFDGDVTAPEDYQVVVDSELAFLETTPFMKDGRFIIPLTESEVETFTLSPNNEITVLTVCFGLVGLERGLQFIFTPKVVATTPFEQVMLGINTEHQLKILTWLFRGAFGTTPTYLAQEGLSVQLPTWRSPLIFTDGDGDLHVTYDTGIDLNFSLGEEWHYQGNQLSNNKFIIYLGERNE